MIKKKGKANVTAEVPVEAPSADAKKPKSKRSGNLFETWKLVAAVLVLALVIMLGTWVWRSVASKSEMSNDDIVIRVSRELQISGDGNPAILTVDDATKVSQPFLEGSQNGDKVLLYYKAKKSVLYRPSEDKIVRSGSYSPPDAKIFVRKGTPDDAKVSAANDKLNAVENADVASQDNSTKQDYPKTLVVSVTDRYSEQTAEVARALNAEIVRLPKGETVPDADILVIVGNQ